MIKSSWDNNIYYTFYLEDLLANMLIYVFGTYMLASHLWCIIQLFSFWILFLQYIYVYIYIYIYIYIKVIVKKFN